MSGAYTGMPSSAGGDVITENRSCQGCGYNLRGLRVGGQCPECGRGIALPRLKKVDFLGDAPDAWIGLFLVGLLMMIAGGLAGTFGLIIGRLFGSLETMIVSVAGSGLWVAGTMLTTRRRPPTPEIDRREHGRAEWSNLRLVVRGTQSFAVLASGLALTAFLTQSAIVDWLTFVSIMVVIAGFVPLCVYLSNIANWASDDQSTMQFMSVGIGIGAFGLLVSFFYTPLQLPLGFFILFLGIPGLLICVAWMFFLLIQLYNSALWAKRNSRHAADRDARMAERARREAEAARIDGTHLEPIHDQPDPHLLASIEATHEEWSRQQFREGELEVPDGPRPGRHHQREITKSDDATPYDLEDDD